MHLKKFLAMLLFYFCLSSVYAQVDWKKRIDPKDKSDSNCVYGISNQLVFANDSKNQLEDYQQNFLLAYLRAVKMLLLHEEKKDHRSIDEIDSKANEILFTLKCFRIIHLNCIELLDSFTCENYLVVKIAHNKSCKETETINDVMKEESTLKKLGNKFKFKLVQEDKFKKDTTSGARLWNSSSILRISADYLGSDSILCEFGESLDVSSQLIENNILSQIKMSKGFSPNTFLTKPSNNLSFESNQTKRILYEDEYYEVCNPMALINTTKAYRDFIFADN